MISASCDAEHQGMKRKKRGYIGISSRCWEEKNKEKFPGSGNGNVPYSLVSVSHTENRNKITSLTLNR